MFSNGVNVRKSIEDQLIFGHVDISKIKFDLKSRDEIPSVLQGLQSIYMNEDLRKQIFEILETKILPNSNKRNGRPGMNLWKILVLGILRVNLNWDYDKLHEMINNHIRIRQLLGHTIFDNDYTYNLQTLKDNINLLTPELINEINEKVVRFAHSIVKKKPQKL
jgi:hypothetical protein